MSTQVGYPMIRLVGMLLLTIALLLTTRGAISQSGTRQPSSSGPKAMTASEFQKRFWAYLTASRSAYRNWERFPDSEKSTVGKFPHGSFVRIFANRRTVRNPLTPPNGAIIVQENYAVDKKTLLSISVMYRAAGYDAKHGDWYWTQYLRDGSLARGSPQAGHLPIAGRIASCIKCHSTAQGSDLLFANDRLGRSSVEQTADGRRGRSARK